MKKLAFGIVVAVLAVPASAQTEGNWVLRLQSDPMTDERVGGASLMAVDGSRLLFTCNGVSEKMLSVQYMPKGFLGSSDNYVTIRFDTDKPFPSTIWTYAGDGAYTVSPAYVDAFSVAVGTGDRTIRVRGLDCENQPIDATFLSKNGLAAINEVRLACKKSAL